MSKKNNTGFKKHFYEIPNIVRFDFFKANIFKNTSEAYTNLIYRCINHDIETHIN